MKSVSGANDRHFRLAHNQSNKNATFDFHFHEGYEVLYFLAGEVQYYIEDESYSLVPGDVLIIPPGRLHRLVTVDENITYERMVMNLSVEYCKRLLQRVPHHFVHQNGRCCHIPLGENDSDFRKMMQGLLRLGSDEAGILERDATVTLLLLQLQRYMQALPPAGGDGGHRMQQIIRYINAHFTEPLTLEDIAERFYISKYHLLRQFKQYTHSTVHNYILKKRVLLAKALLSEGVPSAKVAVTCGFGSYVGFYQAFYHETGQSPTTYKKEIS